MTLLELIKRIFNALLEQGHKMYDKAAEVPLLGLVLKGNFFIRRFHSLIALIPIGVFMCLHILLNGSVLISGNESYLALITFMKTAPFIWVLEIIIIALPLLFHAIYGIWIVYLAKNNILKYTYYRNWCFYLQRLTAIIVVIFLLFHVSMLRFMVHEPQAIINQLAGILHNPLYFVLYIIGVLASIYHFANGLFTFCITWGICVGERAQKIFSWAVVAIFIVLSALAITILTKIATMPLP